MICREQLSTFANTLSLSLIESSIGGSAGIEEVDPMELMWIYSRVLIFCANCAKLKAFYWCSLSGNVTTCNIPLKKAL